jgi:hypothetical protein
MWRAAAAADDDDDDDEHATFSVCLTIENHILFPYGKPIFQVLDVEGHLNTRLQNFQSS